MPVSSAQRQACGLNTQVPPWEGKGLVALCGPTGRMQAAATCQPCRQTSLPSVLLGATIWKFKRVEATIPGLW